MENWKGRSSVIVLWCGSLAVVFLLSVVGCTTNTLVGHLSTFVSINSLQSRTATLESSIPPNCNVVQITQLIDNFTSAYNVGSFEELRQYFGLDHFVYFVGGNKAGQSYEEIRTSDWIELSAYFRQRHTHHEEIKQLQTLQISHEMSDGDGLLISYVLSRRADDFPEARAAGKAIVDCKSVKIVRWIWYGFDLP